MSYFESNSYRLKSIKSSYGYYWDTSHPDIKAPGIVTPKSPSSEPIICGLHESKENTRVSCPSERANYNTL
jgi:hypothetical protein